MKTKRNVLSILIMCLAVIGMVSNVLGTLTVPSKEYNAHPGSSVDIPVSNDQGGYNTTTEIFNISYDYYVYAPPYSKDSNPNIILGSFIKKNFTADEVEYIQDGDPDTAVQMSAYGVLTGDWYGNGIGVYYMKVRNLQDFNGFWIKKSVDMGLLGFYMSNSTVGDLSIVSVTDDLGDPISVAPWRNLSYINDIYLTNEGGTYTYPEYVEEYGEVDNITVAFTGGTPPDVFSKYSSISEYIDHELLLYEFHLFHTGSIITDVTIIDDQGMSIPWGWTSEEVTSIVTMVTISVPSTARIGSYYVLIEDNLGNSVTTTIQVTGSENSIWIWIYPIIAFGVGLGFLGLSDMARNRARDPALWILLGAIGVVSLVLCGVFVTDIMGWYPHIGLI